MSSRENALNEKTLKAPSAPASAGPDPVGGEFIETRNPATGESIARHPVTTADEIATALRAADALVAPARRDPAGLRAKRKEMLLAAALLLERDVEAHAAEITREMGKTLKASREEVLKCAVSIRAVVAEIDHWLAPIEVELAGGKHGRSEFHPLGILLAVMPWNFPYWQVVRAFIPAALLGNPFILKHASNVSGCARRLEALFRDAGAEPGLFQVLLLRGDRILPVAGDPRVRAVTLTGSEAAGRAIAEVAGRGLKKVVLELGGSDPFIVTATADVKLAAETAAKSRLLSNGQSCVSAKRFLIEESVYADFKEALLTELKKIRMGSPTDESTTLGPLVNAEAREGLESLRADALKNLASELYRGENPFPADSAYFPVTVLESIPNHARLRMEEAFGPLFSLYSFESREHALSIANETTFGLGASVWSTDPAERDFFRENLDCGMIFFNTMVASDAKVPFGGTKNSGFGRELGEVGIREFALVKTVVL